jgi:transglutaminase-like putative cysteine protease
LGPNPELQHQWFQEIEYLGSPVEYNVIMEPTFQNWIFTLQVPRFADDRMFMRRDYQVSTQRRVTQRFTYNGRSWLDHRVGLGSQQAPLGASLLIPGNSNPRARDFADRLRATVPSDEAYIAAVLEHFRNEPFFYTLSPPVLSENPVDEFLFDTREGFCEHYASSFTYLMRAAGIPARVVTGYQGGEFNPYDGTLTVRQYDAHAWSEVWLPERGWQRVDPTAAVAPERISQGSDVALQQEENFMEDELFTLMRFRNSLLLNDLRFRLEMIDYAWNRFVLNYDQETQFQLFTRIFGTVTRLKIVAAIVVFMGLVMLFIAFTIFRRPVTNPRAPALVQYLRFCDYLGKLGYARRPGETPLHYLERVGAANPQWRGEIEAVTRAFVALAYENGEAQADRLTQLQNSVRRFRVLN